MENEWGRQMTLSDFNGNLEAICQEGQKRDIKRRLVKRAKTHFKQGFIAILESMEGRSIDIGRVNILLNRTMKEIEMKGICYLKKTRNGKVRLFKRF